MKKGLRIAMFGSSLVSAYWNGAATYYRGIIRAMHRRGHRVTFFEPDAFDRQRHRDMDDPDWAKVVVYDGSDLHEALRALESARGYDLIIKASGVGVFDRELEEAVLDARTGDARVAFWDVDAPATLDRMLADPQDPFRSCVPQYDLILTYGGGPPVVSAYERLGARRCEPIYNAADPGTHFPVAPQEAFAGTLGFLGNRLPDREARVEEWFLRVAERMPRESFLLGGNGWGDRSLPANVRYLGHVYTRDHNAFNCTPHAVLNICRDSMARYGFSPATRVFEAAAAGACIITDAWEGLEAFFAPDEEILTAPDGNAVEALLGGLDGARAKSIGQAARERVLAEHTYDHRAEQFEQILEATCPV